MVALTTGEMRPSQIPTEMILQFVRWKPHGVFYVPPLSQFLGRAHNRAQELCESGRTYVDAAKMAIAAIQEEDELRVFEAMRPAAEYYHRYHRLRKVDPDDLVHEAFIKGHEWVRRKFSPSEAHGGSTEEQLRRCVNPIVRCVALKMGDQKYVRRAKQSEGSKDQVPATGVQSRRIWNGLDDLISEQTAVFLNLSEFEMSGIADLVLASLSPEERRTWRAICTCESSEEAGGVVECKAATFRRRKCALFQRFRELMGDVIEEADDRNALAFIRLLMADAS